MFEHIRTKFGEEVELLHDMHERVPLSTAVTMCKELEQYHPYFIEDPLPPEETNTPYHPTVFYTVPIKGELFNTIRNRNIFL